MLGGSDRDYLLTRQRRALQYFLDNQTPAGLFLDRQTNREVPRSGWCSTAATGMGLISMALASAEPYRFLSTAEAVQRIRAALETALFHLPSDHGMMPHFLDATATQTFGQDTVSTIDSSWLLAGGLWGAVFLADPGLQELATQLYERVDWHFWTNPENESRGLIAHGKGPDGQLLGGSWDRLDGECIFMYVLGAGAADSRALPATAGAALKPFYGTVTGLRFNNADLGLFAFEYGLDLLDMSRWRGPGGIDLAAEARLATRANRLFCAEAADRFVTYRRYWGLSDGDGPGPAAGTDAYRAYGPGLPLDGTAHLIATLAAVGNAPEEVLDNLRRADHDKSLPIDGRYGHSNVNLDRHWTGRDIVGIDAGAAVLALDNFLVDNRVRRVFHALPCVDRGLARLGFTRAQDSSSEKNV